MNRDWLTDSKARAQVFGTSGAWKQIVESLSELDLSLDHPDELIPVLDDLKTTYAERVLQFQSDIDEQIAASKSESSRLMEATQTRIKIQSHDVAAKIAPLDFQLAEFKAERGLLRYLKNYFRVRGIQRLRQSLHDELSTFIQSQQELVTRLRRQTAQLENNKGRLIQEEKNKLDQRIVKLGRILKSPELAGAQAELEVVEILSKLPTEYWVFHDVRLKANRFMRFKGDPIQSAQVDHVVLTRAGVFVIEVKNWSQTFVDSRVYFDPFTQIERASRLCYVILRERGYNIKVRSIIANRGKLPNKSADQYVKILQPDNLPGYLQYFQNTLVATDEIDTIAQFLRNMVA